MATVPIHDDRAEHDLSTNHEALDAQAIFSLEEQRVRAVPLLLQTGLLTLEPGPAVAGRPQQCRAPNEYGRRSLSIDGLQGQSDLECYDLAVATVSRYKDPAARIRSLTIRPRANVAGLFPVVRDLEIGDKVTFRRLPLGTGSAFTKTLTVEGISHSIGVDGEWVTTLLTAPANMPSFLILDSGTLGQLDEEKLGF
jgi:hypothetical protein